MHLIVKPQGIETQGSGGPKTQSLENGLHQRSPLIAEPEMANQMLPWFFFSRRASRIPEFDEPLSLLFFLIYLFILIV